MSDLNTAIYENASTVARRYKRKCWWASVEDMKQEATKAQLQAAPNFDETWGRPIAGYLYKVALYAARAVVLKSSSPVSATHDLRVLKGLYRAPLTEVAHKESSSDSESAYRARQIFDQVVLSIGKERADFAYALFVDGWKPQEIAQANGVSVSSVYAEVARIREALRSNEQLWNMWRDE